MLNIYYLLKKSYMSKKINSDFDPVKEEKDGVRAKRAIWSTKSLELALKGIEQGKKLIANPFYENNTKLLKGDLVFQRTEEEIKEWLKCKNDIVYFVEKYCKLMTPEGIKNVTLRDYQTEYLKHLENNRLSIMLSARQAGKCNSFVVKVLVKLDWEKIKNADYKLRKYLFDNYYINEEDCYELPLFELYNLFDNSLKWKIKYQLYKFLYKYGASKET